MRCGLLSDIHGNYYALRAAIDFLRLQGVDAWLCAGDIVGYGPQPNECIETIVELGALCVAGNHELLALEKLSGESSGSLCRETTGWTRSALRDDCRTFLSELPHLLVTGNLVLAHGSLTDPEHYVRTNDQGAEQIRLLDVGHSKAHVLILGHTHRQWVYSEARGTVNRELPAVSLASADRFVINPGAVGQSRQREPVPQARFAILDLDQAAVQFYAIPYDVNSSRAALRRQGLPQECIHLRPGLLPNARQRGRKLLRRLGCEDLWRQLPESYSGDAH